MSPASCPNCNSYESLTTLIGEDLQPTGKIECENCLWVGEADDLGDVDSDD